MNPAQKLKKERDKSQNGFLTNESDYCSVAELAEMPLYSVTCGDIGTKPEAVEMYLNSVLYLGKKWNCGMSRSYDNHAEEYS